MGLFDLLNKKNASVLSFIDEGTGFHESGQFSDAVASFEKALSQDPGRYDAWVGRGSALFYLDRYSDALTSFDKAIEIDPRKSDAWKNRGRTLHELGRPSEAVESYEKAIDCDPGDSDAVYYRGLALQELGRLADAIEVYEQILTTDHNNPDIWFRRGVAEDELGQYTRSIESYDHALAIDPSNAVGWYNRGVALERLQRLQDAVESYQRALEIAPNHPGAQRNLPRVIEEMQRGRRGISDEAIPSPSDESSMMDAESKPTLPVPGSDPESLVREIDEVQIDFVDEGTGSPDEGTPDEDGADEGTPDEGTPDEDGADEGIPDEGTPDEDGADEGIPDEGAPDEGTPDELPIPDPARSAEEVKAEMNDPVEESKEADWAKTAMKDASEGRFEEALLAYDRALEENPDGVYLWLGRGLALIFLEQFNEAVESFDKAIEIVPDNAKVWYNRGLALQQLKRYDDAIDSYDRALSIDSHLSAVRKNRNIALSEKQKEEDRMVPNMATLPLPGQPSSILQSTSPDQPTTPLSQEIPETDEVPPMTKPQAEEGPLEADWHDQDSGSEDDQPREGLSSPPLPIEEDEMPEVVPDDAGESVDVTPPDSPLQGDEAASPPVADTFEAALDEADRALSRNSDDKNAWYNRGVALLHLERFSEALDAYDHALKLDPDMPDTWNNRGVALARLGRHEGAMESYNRALLLDPLHGSSWMNKARTLVELDRPADALESYDRALAINPRDATAWYNRGVLLADMGRGEESVQCLDKALAIGYKTGKEWYTPSPFAGYIDDYAAVSPSDDGDDTPESTSPEPGDGGEIAQEMGEETDADWEASVAMPDLSVVSKAVEGAEETISTDDADAGFGSEDSTLTADDLDDVDLDADLEDDLIAVDSAPHPPDVSGAGSDLPDPDACGELREEDEADADPFSAIADISGDLDTIKAAMVSSEGDSQSDASSDDADAGFGSEDSTLTADDLDDVDLDDIDLEDDLISPDSKFLSPETSNAVSDRDHGDEADEMARPDLPQAPDVPYAVDEASDPDGIEMASGSDIPAPPTDPEEAGEDVSPEEGMLGLEPDSSFSAILKYYDRAAARSPDDADIWYNRGLVLYNLNRYRDAVESFARAVTINPDYAEAERNRRILVALIKKKIIDYEKKGTECATDGRFDEALVYYDQVLSLDPRAHSVWYNRGVALRNLGRYADAVESYDRALALVPEDPGTWYNRGVALRNLGRYEDAIESYDRALALDPDDADTWHNRGVALRKLGRNADAVTSFDRALSINGTDPAIWYNRGIALRQLGRYDDALESYDRMLALDPKNVLALNNRGFLLNELGRHEEAVEAYDTSLLLNPENAGAWLGRGIAEFNQEKYTDAVESLNRGLGIDSDDSYSWQVHGLALARLERHADAVQSYDRAIDLDPSDAKIRVIRGLSLMRVGSYHEAVLSFEQALEMDPDNPDIISHRDEAARMIPVEESIPPMEETSLRAGDEPWALSSPESRPSRLPAASFSVTLDHSRFIRNQWHRVPLTIHNEGGEPLIDLLISFSEDFVTKRLIPVTVPPDDQVTIDIGIKPLSVGMVPLDLSADYLDEEGHAYTRIFEFWIEVVPEA